MDHKLIKFKSVSFNKNTSRLIANKIIDLLLNKKRVFIAISGGKTPLPIYKKLKDYNIDWRKVYFFIVDERNEPITSDRNNFNNINNVFFKHIETNYYSYSNNTDLDFAAKKYEDTIFKKLPLKDNIPNFDLVVLGMGLDGHIASLFPKSPGLLEEKKIEIKNYIEELKEYRLTFTFPLILNSNEIILLFNGAEKNNIFVNSIARPINKIVDNAKDLTIICDK